MKTTQESILLQLVAEQAETFVRFRQDLRQLLADYGVPSNPGWTEDDIVDAFRTLLSARSNTPSH